LRSDERRYAVRRFLPVILALSLLTTGHALAQSDTTYFDATNSMIDRTNPVGTQWHELFPNYCQAPYTIVGWADNGNGILDSCDVICMTNPDGIDECHHVIEVTITLELTLVEPPGTDPNYWDAKEDPGDEPIPDPVCTWWKGVYPDFGEEFHIVGWEDNGSGFLDFCDFIYDHYGNAWHVEGVHTDMVTEPEDECATDESTWSKIKQLFR
jgi:hypothetical protein